MFEASWTEANDDWIRAGRLKRKSRPLGFRLPMPLAQNTLANFLTDPIRDLVLFEVCYSKATTGSDKDLQASVLAFCARTKNQQGENAAEKAVRHCLIRHIPPDTNGTT